MLKAVIQGMPCKSQQFISQRKIKLKATCNRYDGADVRFAGVVVLSLTVYFFSE